MTDTVEPKDVRVDVASNDVFVVDVRDTEEWIEGAERVPGSVHIAPDEIDSRLGEIPDDKRILIVSPDGERGAEIAARIGGEGREVQVLEGGVEAWKGDKLLTQPSPDADPPKPEGAEPVEQPGDDESDEDEGNEG